MYTVLFTATFRNTPSFGCNLKGNNIIDVIAQGERVEALRIVENDWAKICYNGETGYILLEALGWKDVPV